MSPTSLHQYANRIVALSLFFLECFEEGDVGHSSIPGLLSPVTGPTLSGLRDLFLVRWYRDETMSLEQAAFAFHAYAVIFGQPRFGEIDASHAITAACTMYVREPVLHLSEEDRIVRAHLRLARCYQHMLNDGVEHQSRVVDWFVPSKYFGRGISQMRSTRGLAEGTHAEHVVPCAFIRNTALRYLLEGRALADVARMTRRLLTIVDITKAEQKLLDNGADSLRDRMPMDWDVERGCIFERLHARSISIKPDEGFACACGTNQF